MRALILTLCFLSLVGCTQNEYKPSANSEKPKARLVVDPATASSITGTISFEGAASKPAPIDMSQDPACVMNVPPNFGQAYVVKEGKLANVYVYVKEGMENYGFDAPKDSLTIDQNGCRYVPHVAAAMVGQIVRFTNSDNALHNVHPSPEKNSQWNISQQPHADAIDKAFDKPELMIPIKCNQHPWMKMFLNVSSHPFYAVTGEDGKFEIEGLPPGEYTIAALHERLGEKTMKVKVGGKDSKPVDFSFRSSDAKN